MTGRELLAALFAGIAAAALSSTVLRPDRRVAGRVRPYVTSVAGFTSAAQVGFLPGGGRVGALVGAFGPLLGRLSHALAGVLGDAQDEVLARKLRQARVLQDMPEPRRAAAYRSQQLRNTIVGAVVGAAVPLALGNPGLAVIGVGLGVVFGASRLRGKVDASIQARRSAMRIELYTVNQVIAMNLKVGGGVVQAIQRVVGRAQGEVVGELGEVLRVHASGQPLTVALTRAASLTPEPHAARTYKLLATAAEYGADLGDALMELSEDIREDRVEFLRRSATKKTASMLLPIIGILAPTMLLFIAAPIPSIVTGSFN